MAKRDNLDIMVSQIANDVSRKINVAHLCSIHKINEDNSEADVQPLALTENGEKRPLIIGAHISQHVKNYINKNSVVVVLFVDRNIDNFDRTNKTFPIADKRSHSLNDAVIVGVI